MSLFNINAIKELNLIKIDTASKKETSEVGDRNTIVGEFPNLTKMGSDNTLVDPNLIKRPETIASAGENSVAIGAGAKA